MSRTTLPTRLTESEIRLALDAAVARNGGPSRAYSGEPGEIRNEQWHLERASESAGRARNYEQKSARDALIEKLLALPDAELADAIKLLNARKQ